jgi:hypothetical protein
MSRVWETICGVWELGRLAAASRFKLRSDYWRWRYETAFGNDPAARPGVLQRWRSMLDYGRWVHRMKRR